MPTSGQSLNAAAIEKLITQRVTEAMAAYEANQNGNGNPNVNVGGVVPVACECTYQDFLKCQPLNFKGTERVVGLTRWFEKMETVFYISNYLQNCQVKYAPCTLQDSALTWWNSHKRTIGTNAAYAMTWKALIKLMTEMVPEEEDRVEKFIGGLPDNIQGNVIANEPIRLQHAIQIANNLMDQKLKGYAAKDAENKRRFDNDPRDNRVQQPPFKRQNVARAYTVGNNKNKGYVGILPLCDKYKLHHHGSCPVRCGNCKKVGHQARDCWAPTTMTCYGCGEKGHTKRYCLELENVNGDGEARQNLDIVMAEGDLMKFSDIGAWYAIEDCAQYEKKYSNPTSVISDETIANPNAQIVMDDIVRVQVPRCMTWLDYNEHVDSLSTMDNEVGVTSLESTIQTLPSFEEYTPPVTYPKEVEKTLGTPIEVKPLNETKLEEVGLNCNHNTPFSSREVPSFDGPEPQPVLNSPSLDVSLGDVIGPEPPIKSHSPDSSRMKVRIFQESHEKSQKPDKNKHETE
ncbi:putative reverse transcriptase domain-containing protein [Tanacetum coccineum]